MFCNIWFDTMHVYDQNFQRGGGRGGGWGEGSSERCLKRGGVGH